MSDLETPLNPLPDEEPFSAPEPETLGNGPASETQADSDAPVQEVLAKEIEEDILDPDQEQTVSPVEAPISPTEGAITPLPPGKGARRSGLSSSLAAILLIALGIILVWPALSGGMLLVPGLIILIAAVGLTLALLAYWQDQHRQAYGAFFLGILILFWGILGCWIVLEPDLGGGLGHTWPLFVALLGSAILLTAAFNRSQTTRLLPAGLILTTTGVAATTVVWELLPDSILDLAVQTGPWILVALAVGLLPLAFRRNRHQP